MSKEIVFPYNMYTAEIIVINNFVDDKKSNEK